MIYPDELREILKKANLQIGKFSMMLGKGHKLVSVELHHYEHSGMPLSHKRSKQVLELIDRQICVDVLGADVCNLIEGKIYFTKKQFRSLLKILGTNSNELARTIGLDDKSLYMLLRNNQGLNFNSVLNLYLYFPNELDIILTEAQKSRILYS